MPRERTIAVRTYVVVCVLLVLLTVLTVGLSFWHVPPVWHVVMGLSIALVKAALVVLFFMHVLVSPRLIWIVLAVTCFWLGILLVLTLADYFSREMVPGMFGH
ncbi:MAG TPA: cytochrome C oxidase subunit IV family protein [Gemmataceae bacterium]|nr:cytochrome C oxidase subunit IV family protein [Gemmataceae bacterium]